MSLTQLMQYINNNVKKQMPSFDETGLPLQGIFFSFLMPLIFRFLVDDFFGFDRLGGVDDFRLVPFSDLCGVSGEGNVTICSGC